eukprot:CAMPEP_0204904736 /NCGR_PEP_ID=MMETSP1397-20131031/5034_1 /ASSEMBLY_ACC=CAM_ASM_000891 /TAXON_ID=49980 /ORGANISM="Climacostomum Climacostomum virens, Strain Stock W-24" /LENGTH=209 /DNA_ID=CAMNT_0052073555 /DNA_START=486 /DNA_END=1115 /DNA_ORIENTATION=+
MFASLAFWKKSKSKQAEKKEQQNTLISAIQRLDLQTVIEICERDPQAVLATSYQGHGCLIFAANCGDPGIVEYLIDHGCDVNGLSKNGETPLIRATVMNKVAAADVLIRRGANIDYTGNRVQNCLFLAIQRDKPKMVDYLMRKGANHRIVFELHPKIGISDTVRKIIADNLAWRARRGLLWLIADRRRTEAAGLPIAKKQLLLEVTKFL